ncbi:MAG: cysteine hydrolase [Planctomycetota bacterium]|nr:cysteine hydrolase [Planctomycetota bacterium]
MNATETAVVLIEFQNEFCRPDGKFHNAVKEEVQRQGTIGNAVKLATQARAKGCLIVHCPFILDRKWAATRCVAGIIAKIREGSAFLPGSWGADFIEELKPAPGEIVLGGKRALSGFTHTGLARVLKKRGIRNVVCAGFLSNVCVEATARSAYDKGFHVVVAKDATAAASRANQEYVEKEIYPVLGDAMSVDEILKALA